MRQFLLAGALFLFASSAGFAETAKEIEQRLPTLSAVPRLHALAELTDLLRNDQPKKALTYGREALALLPRHRDAAVEVRVLNEMGWAHMMLGEYDEATATLDRSEAIAGKNGDLKGLSRAINNRGVLSQRRGDVAHAIESFTRSLEVLRRLGDPALTAMALNNLGFVYSADLADYERGLGYHLEALKLREQLADKQGIALSLNNIGIIYGRMREYDRALDYFHRALDIRRELGLRQRIAATLHNIAEIELERGAREKALEVQQEALALRREVDDKAGVAISLRAIGEIHLAMGDFRSAQNNLTTALRMGEELGDKTLMASNLLALSALHRARRQGPQAVVSARQALAIAEAMNGKELIRRALLQVAESEEAAGNYVAALASYKKFKERSDEIFDEEKTKRFGQLELLYQKEKREREIERLRQEKVVRDLEISRERVQRNALAGLALAVVLVGVLLYRRRAEIARINEELSLTDSLTTLRNRRFVTQTIEADVAASRRKHAAGSPDADLVFYLLDLDRFKALNDELGHAAGDEVLQEVARVLGQTCRSSDTIARWGGEEFLIISRFTARDTAAEQAERIRRAVEETERCTCSIGFASFPFSRLRPEALGWADVVNLADEALYAAKNAGRNAWVGVHATDVRERDLRKRSLAELVKDGSAIVERSGDYRPPGVEQLRVS